MPLLPEDSKVICQERSEPWFKEFQTGTGRLRTGWGFACLLRLPQKTILFDTGGDSSTLLFNMRQLQIDPKTVDVVVLSHRHGDHTGGLSGFLKQNSDVTIYLLKSFPRSFKAEVESLGASVDEGDKAREPFPGVYTTGELGFGIREQSLIVSANEGLVVVTGCAHPGVLNIVRVSKEITKERVYLVLGGFHSPPASAVRAFKELGVEKVAPCHCSGDRIRHLFQEHYGGDSIEIGVGRRPALPGVTQSR